MRRAAVVVGTMGFLSIAPFQCPAKPDPTRAREDTPGEALYDLAGQLGKSGDKEGQIRTLRYLAEKYPRSRFAATARDDLNTLGAPLPASTIEPDAEREAIPFGRLPGDKPAPSAAPSAAAPEATAAPAASSHP